MITLTVLRQSVRFLAAVLATAAGLITFASPAAAVDGIIGNGSPASCTEAVFDSIFYSVESYGGGTITFNCGPAPHTITFSTMKSVSANTDIRGGDLITLSGANATSLFQVDHGQALALRNIALVRAYGTFGAVQSFGRLTIDSSQIANSIATLAGGAIQSYGNLTITNSLIISNTATQIGGAIHTDGGAMTIANSRLEGNTAAEGGGIAASTVASVTIRASQFTGNRATATFAQGGAIRSEGALAVIDSTFRGNSSSRGGAISILSGAADVTHSTISGNWAAYGGGIRQEGGALTVGDVQFTGNGYSSNGTKVTTGGGALSWGAGLATLNRVTMSGNWASYGGGFDHAGGTTSLINSTISGNGAVGGGGFDQGGGSIALTNVTIVGNSAPFLGGGVGNRAGTLTAASTLLSGNYNSSNSQSWNCYQTVAGNGFSLSSDYTCSFGAGHDNIALLIGSLANNGGFTLTHLPMKRSPTIDAGAGIGCPAADQRGVARPQGQACDVGSVEVTPSEMLSRVYSPLIVK